MLEKTKKFIPFILTGAAILTNPLSVFGADLKNESNIVPQALFQTSDLPTVIGSVIKFIIIVAFVIAFIMLIVGGIRWIMAGGDEKAVEKARGTITAALIGLVVVLLAFALIRLVEMFFGVNIISGFTIPKANSATNTTL